MRLKLVLMALCYSYSLTFRVSKFNFFLKKKKNNYSDPLFINRLAHNSPFLRKNSADVRSFGENIVELMWRLS